MSTTALFPGTFDPVTLGHEDIIKRAGSVCDKLYVAVGINSSKNCIFSADERLDMLRKVCADLPYVEVVSFEGLAIDFAKEVGVNCLLRGLRAFSDFEYEFRMALANRKMSRLETIFLMTSPGFSHVSSSLLRDVGRYSGDLTQFVSDDILPQVTERLCET